MDSFLGSIIRSIDEEEKIRVEEKEERQAAVGGSSLRSKASRVISPPLLLPREGEAACTYVNAWAGHATERTGFSSSTPPSYTVAS